MNYPKLKLAVGLCKKAATKAFIRRLSGIWFRVWRPHPFTQPLGCFFRVWYSKNSGSGSLPPPGNLS